MATREYQCAGTCCPIGPAQPFAGTHIELVADGVRTVRTVENLEWHDFSFKGKFTCQLRLAGATKEEGDEIARVVCIKGLDD